MSNKISFFVKNQIWQVSILTLWILYLVAIYHEYPREGVGEVGVLLLMALTSVPVLLYFTTGRKITVDLLRGHVTKSFVLLGVPLSSRRLDITPQALLVMPKIHHYGSGGDHHKYARLCYDLCLGTHETQDQPAGAARAETEPEMLKAECLFFGGTERRARKAARALQLPVYMRWDLLQDTFETDRKEHGALHTPFVMPENVKKHALRARAGGI